MTRYRILRKLGEGGMGQVFLGIQVALERQVAIKTLRALDPSDTARFRVEGKLLSKLNHPGVVAVHDAGEDNGLPYLVCEYVEGATLREHLSCQQPSVQRAVQIACAVLEGLSAAHAQGIHHRDVKPENIFVTPDGAIKLGDFGLAGVQAAPGPALTRTGIIVGTPTYMSPEQVQGEKVDGRTDVYSVGVLLYEMLAGQLPFQADTVAGILYHHVHSAPVPLRTHRPEIPVRLEDAVLKSLRKARDQRFTDAADFRRELMECFGSGPSYTPPPQPADAAPPVAFLAAPLETGRVPALPPAGGPSRPGHRKVLAGGTLAVLLLGGAWAVRGPGAVCDLSHPPVPASLHLLGDHAKGAKRFRHEKDGAVLVLVPAGEFLMGSDLEPDEGPPHEVCLPDYYIEETEVTRARFQVFLTAASYVPSGQYALADSVADSVMATLPATGVSWSDAVAYATWVGRRLPTEAEWEKAARGSDGRQYPWGHAKPSPELAVFGSGPHLARAPERVGSRLAGASAAGCLDLAGNVWEWCADWYQSDYYREAPPVSPPGPAGGTKRVVRGGSFRSQGATLSGTRRLGHPPSFSADDVGFRTVMDSTLAAGGPHGP
ncbi:MAG: SUMF1/EgtB/PvdO family nonheme iron enzyme [Candidatus Riflebacteria bacterium]|nr:SUMF1/EgtB/PvdO family nonheme iron enzyme [Candidatus Riflebacteria bacterium]